jgi:hypothetical protein
MGSPEPLEFAGGLPHLLRLLEDGACFPRASKLMDSTNAWSLLQHPSPLSAPTPGGSGRVRRFLLLRGRPWAARGSHAPPWKAPTSPDLLLLFLCLFVCFTGLICCISISCLPLFWCLGHCDSIHLSNHLQMAIPALWHPCLEPKGSHFRKHCPRVILFLDFLGCPSLLSFFLSCCNWFLMYLIIIIKINK